MIDAYHPLVYNNEGAGKCPLAPALVYFLFTVTSAPPSLRWLWIPRTCVLFQLCQSTHSSNLSLVQLSSAPILLCWSIPGCLWVWDPMWPVVKWRTSQDLKLEVLTNEGWKTLYKLFSPPVRCINFPVVQFISLQYDDPEIPSCPLMIGWYHKVVILEGVFTSVLHSCLHYSCLFIFHRDCIP